MQEPMATQLTPPRNFQGPVAAPLTPPHNFQNEHHRPMAAQLTPPHNFQNEQHHGPMAEQTPPQNFQGPVAAQLTPPHNLQGFGYQEPVAQNTFPQSKIDSCASFGQNMGYGYQEPVAQNTFPQTKIESCASLAQNLDTGPFQSSLSRNQPSDFDIVSSPNFSNALPDNQQLVANNTLRIGLRVKNGSPVCYLAIGIMIGIVGLLMWYVQSITKSSGRTNVAIFITVIMYMAFVVGGLCVLAACGSVTSVNAPDTPTLQSCPSCPAFSLCAFPSFSLPGMNCASCEGFSCPDLPACDCSCQLPCRYSDGACICCGLKCMFETA